MKNPDIKDKSPVSLTGHFTGYVWCKNHLSPNSFSSLLGKAMYYGTRPVDWLSNVSIGINLETMLLQRHCLIDKLVNQAIDDGVTQIIEIASGLSARGMRVLKNHPDDNIRYIEADLPDMVAWKSKRLNKEGFSDQRHQLSECNILRDKGELSIEHILSTLDKAQKTLVISEGLVNYFPLEVIEMFWVRLAYTLSEFNEGQYIFEIWPKASDHPFAPMIYGTQKLIEFITRQTVPLHYTSNQQIKAGIEGCGFSLATVIDPDTFTASLKVPKMDTPTLFRIVQAQAGK